MLSPAASAVFVYVLFVRGVPSYTFSPLSAVIVTAFFVTSRVPFAYVIS